ncbi:hypothetical protein CFREI_10910 [Corynebacterium freiburgense]|nr:hypothetical protein CFREI_10910 [Corynebacterium freiburgense]
MPTKLVALEKFGEAQVMEGSYQAALTFIRLAKS